MCYKGVKGNKATGRVQWVGGERTGTGTGI